MKLKEKSFTKNVEDSEEIVDNELKYNPLKESDNK